MDPKPIPPKLIEAGVGIPKTFVADDPTIGDLQILVLVDPRQLRALLQGKEPPFPPGTTDLWISWWEPDELERHQIAQGAPIRLVIHGATNINPLSMGVGYHTNDLANEENQN